MDTTRNRPFGTLLRARCESRGLTGYRLEPLTGLRSALVYDILNGKRPPSDAIIEALAGVPELGLTLDELRAWRDLDRIGREGLDRIARYLPDLLAPPLAS